MRSSCFDLAEGAKRLHRDFLSAPPTGLLDVSREFMQRSIVDYLEFASGE
jgi:hypothetical protein